MGEHVTKRTHPELDWYERPRGFYVVGELVQTDAFRSLSKFETDLLLFIMTRRVYPSNRRNSQKKGKMDYWSPLNGYEITIPLPAVNEFFSKNGMKRKRPSGSTITRALTSLMFVGFISLVKMGGSGKGDMSVYRLEHNWRVWREGDGPCFVKGGMSRAKGFCVPGSRTFCPVKNRAKN